MKTKINDHMTFSLEADTSGFFTLHIRGQGPMPDLPDAASQPWHDASDRITSVVVGEGIVSVGDCSFWGLSQLSSVQLPSSVRFVGTFSFRNCPGLEEIAFPEGLENVGSKAFMYDSGLRVIRFPSTLRTIDIKSFKNCTGITDVYYNGTPWQWAHYIVVDNSYSANDTVLNAAIHYSVLPDAAADFDDVTADLPCLPEIQLMYERSLMRGHGRLFCPGGPLSAGELFSILYLHSGADSLYGDSLSWAGVCLGLSALPETGTTLEFLCLALYRLTRHNGHFFTAAGLTDTPARPSSAALDWARDRGYLEKLLLTRQLPAPDQPLTRVQCACVLSSYLSSPESISDRHEEITADLKKAIGSGGDGQFHIAALNMNKRGLFVKVGDCTLLVLPRGSLMLIDCGFTEVSEKVIQTFRELGVTSLDYLVFSHCHLDHTGGGPAICRYFYEECGGSIGEFWYTGANPENGNITPVTEYLAGKGVPRQDIKVDEAGPFEQPAHRTVDGVDITFFGPNQQDIDAAAARYIDDTVNDTSLVMRFTFGSSVYLTSGDLYADKERYLLEAYGPEAFRATVAKANHHGNHTSSCQEWIDAVHPQVVFADTDGCGSIDVRKRYLGSGIPYYATGFDGAIIITMDDRGNLNKNTQYDSILRLKWPDNHH